MAFTIVKSSSGRDLPSNLLEVLIDGAADLSAINPNASPGSTAYTANGAYKYVKDNDGTWKRNQSASGGSGGSGSGGGSQTASVIDHVLTFESPAASVDNHTLTITN